MTHHPKHRLHHRKQHVTAAASDTSEETRDQDDLDNSGTGITDSQGKPLLDGILSIVAAIFKALFGEPDEPTQHQLETDKSLARTSHMKIGKLPISDEAVVKWKAYLDTHKGESVTIASPVKGDCFVSSGFGEREIEVKGASHNHKGVDLGARGCDHILAAADGVVICSGKFGTAGNTLIIGHADGRFTTYMHLRDHSGMPKVGTEVKQGEQIALMGNTSTLSIAKHLHFELHDQSGKAVQPEIAGVKVTKGDYIAAAGKTRVSNEDYATLVDPDTLPNWPVTQTNEPSATHGNGARLTVSISK